MGVLSTVTKLFGASRPTTRCILVPVSSVPGRRLPGNSYNEPSQSTHRGDGAGDAPSGASCAERIPDTDVGGDSASDCPDCEESLTVERSPGATGCAC